MAKLLKQEFPDKYRHVTDDHLRQMLSSPYQRKKKLEKLDDLDAFDAAMWAHMLGETK